MVGTEQPEPGSVWVRKQDGQQVLVESFLPPGITMGQPHVFWTSNERTVGSRNIHVGIPTEDFLATHERTDAPWPPYAPQVDDVLTNNESHGYVRVLAVTPQAVIWEVLDWNEGEEEKEVDEPKSGETPLDGFVGKHAFVGIWSPDQEYSRIDDSGIYDY